MRQPRLSLVLRAGTLVNEKGIEDPAAMLAVCELLEDAYPDEGKTADDWDRTPFPEVYQRFTDVLAQAKCDQEITEKN